MLTSKTLKHGRYLFIYGCDGHGALVCREKLRGVDVAYVRLLPPGTIAKHITGPGRLRVSRFGFGLVMGADALTWDEPNRCHGNSKTIALDLRVAPINIQRSNLAASTILTFPDLVSSDIEVDATTSEKWDDVKDSSQWSTYPVVQG